MATQKSFIQYPITSAGGNIPRDVNDNCDGYEIVADGGFVTLGANMTFSVTGTPAVGQIIEVDYQGGVSISTYTLTILGYVLGEWQALGSQKFIFRWNGASWDTFMATNDAQTGSFLYDGYYIFPLSIKNGSIKDDEISLSKLQPITPAEFVVGQVAGNASVAFSGAITVDENGVATLQNSTVLNANIGSQAVTTDKISTVLQTQIFEVDVNFETGELGAYLYNIPFPCTVISIYAYATKAIAAADNGTIVLKNNAGTTMTVTTPIVFTAADARGTAYSSAVTANNSFVAGDKLTVFTAKATAGGKVSVSLTLLRS